MLQDTIIIPTLEGISKFTNTYLFKELNLHSHQRNIDQKTHKLFITDAILLWLLSFLFLTFLIMFLFSFSLFLMSQNVGL